MAARQRLRRALAKCRRCDQESDPDERTGEKHDRTDNLIPNKPGKNTHDHDPAHPEAYEHHNDQALQVAPTRIVGRPESDDSKQGGDQAVKGKDGPIETRYRIGLNRGPLVHDPAPPIPRMKARVVTSRPALSGLTEQNDHGARSNGG
jgi:hypothetical protein